MAQGARIWRRVFRRHGIESGTPAAKTAVLADTTDNLARELEEYLAERVRYDEENKKAGGESQ